MPYLIILLSFILILLIFIIFYFKYYKNIKIKQDSYNKSDSVLIKQGTANNNILSKKNNKILVENPFDEQINELNIATSETNIINKQELESFKVDEYEVEKNKKYIPYKPKYKLQENI